MTVFVITVGLKRKKTQRTQKQALKQKALKQQKQEAQKQQTKKKIFHFITLLKFQNMVMKMISIIYLLN